MHPTLRRAASLVLAAGSLMSAARPARAAVPRAAADTVALSADTASASEAADASDAPAPAADGGRPAAADSVGLVARLLAANGAPRHRAAPAARAIMKYARQRSLDPLLIIGIIGVENAELVPRARSRVGAQGVMQVMPSWKRDITDCGGDLRDVYVNVCFGTRILRIALDASSSVREALLRYNGCVRAPGCHRYAAAVFSQAGRAVVLSRMLAAADTAAAQRSRPSGKGPAAAAM